MSTTAPDFLAASPLSADAARLFIGARLAQLDHAPDFLDSQAVAALIDYAAGSPLRLRAALASTLFLASTENALHVGRALVERALHDDDARAAPRLRHPRSRLAWPVAGAALTGIAVALAASLLPNRVRPPTLLPAPNATPASHLAASVPRPPPAAAIAPKPEPASKPQPHAPARAILSPPPTPTPPPLTEQRVAAPVVPPDILPAAPPATAILMYSARDPAALSRLDTLVRRLRQAGIGQIETRAVAASGPARRSVSYFFADDYEPAQVISSVLLSQGWPRMPRNSLAPRLVLTPTGVALRHPGLIEVWLP